METLNLFGKEWYYGMEHGRRVHPLFPNVVFTEDCVITHKNEFGDVVELSTHKLDEPITTHHWDGKDYVSNYAIGGISTCEPYTYGRFEIMARLPKGSAQWAAFWLTGDKTWPPEIDVFETYNTYNGCTWDWPDPACQFKNGFAGDDVKHNCLLPTRKIQPNVHWDRDPGHKYLKVFNVPFNLLDSPYNKFQKYAVLWTPDLIQIEYNNHIIIKCQDKTILSWFNEHPYLNVVLNNNYLDKIQLGEKEEKNVKKTTFCIYDFKYIAL